MSDQSPSFERLARALRALRVRPLFGFAEEDQAFQRRVWATFAQLQDLDGLSRWTASVRHALWGQSERWEKTRSLVSSDVARDGMRRGRLLLGEPVMQFVADDRWRHDAVALEALAPALEEVWTPEALEPVTVNSARLASRFGFVHLRVPAGWSAQRTLDALSAAENGLARMAKSLGWNDADLGAQRLGVSWGLNHDPSLHASYDILNASINIADAGSFAHEWAHALDRGLGEVLNPGLRGDDAFASHQALDWLESRNRWAPAPSPGSAGEVLLAIATRDPAPVTDAERLRVCHDLLHEVPVVLESLRETLPASAGWDERLGQRINAYRKWLNLATSPQPDHTQVKAHWERWRLGCEVAFADSSDEKAGLWSTGFFRLVDNTAEVFFGNLPTLLTWHTWARILDEGQTGAYWSSPHELWARGLHAALHARGAGPWAASPVSMPDQFPQQEEAKTHLAWWNTWLPLWREVWTSRALPGLASELAAFEEGSFEESSFGKGHREKTGPEIPPPEENSGVALSAMAVESDLEEGLARRRRAGGEG
jgi:hypothetical protein